MSYDENLEARIRTIVAGWPGSDRRKMFGGVCFLGGGNMICGVWQDYLILRLGEAGALAALGEPDVFPFDVTGRPMKGWVMISERRLGDENTLRRWIGRARAFHATLPPK